MRGGVFITCSVTGTDPGNPYCPRTPKEIAVAAIAAAQAGAAMVRIRVVEGTAVSTDTALYREVVRLIRESNVDVIVNIACAAGGYISVTDDGRVDRDADKTDFVSQEARMRPVIELCKEGRYAPDLATLDCNTYNHGDGNRTYVAPPDYLRKGARILQELHIKPELAVLDTGNLWFVKQMIQEGLVPAPALIQLGTGTAYGTPTDAGHLLAMVNALPTECIWSSFAPDRMQMPWVAQSALLGGHVRVGLEDNQYLSPGVYATNAQLVANARTLLEQMGFSLMSAAQARKYLRLN
jgi:uncharacterized protein (DUF849 family)